ncbi:MAG: hypothetical protein V2A79_03505 [Planctomycetota bacterium]
MKLRKLMVVIVVVVCMVASTGCRVEGFKQGINDGVSTALTALISTPITHALDERFDGGGE